MAYISYSINGMPYLSDIYAISMPYLSDIYIILIPG